MKFLSEAFGIKKKFPKCPPVVEVIQKVSNSRAIDQQIQFINKFAQQLSKTIVSYKTIQTLSWDGIPSCIRPKIWKYLLKYMLINDAQQILTKKRQEYHQLLINYWNPDHFDEDEKKILRTIDADVKRFGAEYNSLGKSSMIHQTLTRVLFIWHNRHPASGYVQGMCDISMPFLIVFLSEYLPFDEQNIKFTHEVETLQSETIEAVEADMYWCISKIMESVTSNYTQGFDGLKQAYCKVQELLFKIDQDISDHFKKENIDLFAVSFRNISTMLLRMFNPNIGILLFDSYISHLEDFPELMVFILIATLRKFSKKLLTMKFQQLMGFLQNLPTKTWNFQDLQIVISQARCYQQLYSDSQ